MAAIQHRDWQQVDESEINRHQGDEEHERIGPHCHLFARHARDRQRAAEFLHRAPPADDLAERFRSEEHTSELQSLMRISYPVFCLKTKNTNKNTRQQKSNTI